MKLTPVLFSRLQLKPAGRVAVGKFYSGMLSAMAGSFPAAATFWLTYEGAKTRLSDSCGGHARAQPLVHAVAASAGAQLPRTLPDPRLLTRGSQLRLQPVQSVARSKS